MIENLEKYPLLKQVYQNLQNRFGAALISTTFEKDELCVTADRTNIFSIVEYLKKENGFNALNDMVGLDNMNTRKEGEKRFSVLYLLYRFPGSLRIRIKVDIDENEQLPSITGLYRGADWAEREIFDMFGLIFSGHPGLTRIYMPDEFQDFPLRKDYPLEGK